MRYNKAFLLASFVTQIIFFSHGELSAQDYYVDPTNGSDQNNGTSSRSAWRTFKPLAETTLNAGDHVKILPGEYRSSLVIKGEGTVQDPVKISFAQGRFDLFPDEMEARKLHISNTNDTPWEPKKLAIVLDQTKNVLLEGNNTDFYCRGKMIEVFIERSENIKLRGINFDYHRPTVSEFKVLSKAENRAIIEIHPDSDYKVENDKIIWIGEGWSSNASAPGYQRRDTVTGQTVREKNSLSKSYTAKQLEGRKIEIYGENRFGEGDIYQNREHRRDCVGIFHNLSKGVIWENCNLYFLHGMGVISQFTQDITFRNVRFAPREGSGRTCAAWADILHFSGCRGDLIVDNVFFSGANDDAINVHGTYLQIEEKLAGNKLLMRFRHGQTYGFQPFYPGDEVGFVESESLATFDTNKVTSVERKDDKLWIVTLENSAPASTKIHDVLENRTWAPNLTVTNSVVEHIPTRGFLISTRGKVLVEGNHFVGIPRPAILIAGDCKSWFESGAVTDVLIKGNTFTRCKPISVHPENKSIDVAAPVHKNIRLINNTFNIDSPWMTILDAKSTQGIEIRDNTINMKKKPKNIDEKNLFGDRGGVSTVNISSNRINVLEFSSLR
ncbi:MAG: hypothetical protein AAF065_08745 [Verrucomicrobiota bacterium]